MFSKFGHPAICLALLTACNQAGVQNAAPRLTSSIPDQTVNGGATFTLDLASYVSDRETGTTGLTYTVVAGGGSFTGSTYTHTFDTLGSYTVTVRVSDPAGKSLETSFEVRVPTANLGVVTAGNDLQLLDTDTLRLRTLASSGGFGVTFRDALPRGHVVYERQAGTDYDLYVYDANTTATTTLGDDRNITERYVARASADRVLFTAQSATSRALKMFDVTTGETTVIAAADNEIAGDPIVNASGLVYYELTNLGQNDIYVYDPSRNASTAVSTDSRAEDTQGVLADGGLVFSRRGDGGESDLFYYRREVGTVEIGADVAGIASLNKTVAGSNSASLLAFTANNGGQLDFYVWSPALGTTVAVATTSDNETLASVLPSGNFLYYVLAGGTDLNIRLFDVAASASRAFPASAVNDLVVGNLSDSRVVVSKAEATGVHLYLATYAAGTVTDAPIATTAGQNFALDKVLTSAKIVFRNTTSGGVSLFTPGGGTTAIGATAEFVAAMPTAGDFVVKVANGGQFDLSLWDESGSAIVPIATGTTDEELARGLTNGRILFTREVAGSTTRNLFVWNPVDQSVTQVTDDSVDHVVQTTFAADNR